MSVPSDRRRGLMKGLKDQRHQESNQGNQPQRDPIDAQAAFDQASDPQGLKEASILGGERVRATRGQDKNQSLNKGKNRKSKRDKQGRPSTSLYHNLKDGYNRKKKQIHKHLSQGNAYEKTPQTDQPPPFGRIDSRPQGPSAPQGAPLQGHPTSA